MSSIQQGSSAIGGRGKKVVKGEKVTRRTWSPKEEASLIVALKDLVANGWKSDNGFRGGYLTRLEDALSKDFPGTDIKGSPHISSKLQIWKRNYYSLTLMLSRSGVGWNADGKHTIDCTAEQWEQIIKIDTNAKSMLHRPWPMFEDWQLIFGRDRATGDLAEDILDAVNNMVQEESRYESEKQFDENEVRMEDVSVNNDGEDSSSQCEKSKVVNKNQSKGKKRKSNTDGLQAAVEMFCEISRGTNDRLAMVANRVGYQFDVDQAKREAWSLVENVAGLCMEDKFKVVDVFHDELNRMLVFKSLPDEQRGPYVHHILKTKK